MASITSFYGTSAMSFTAEEALIEPRHVRRTAKRKDNERIHRDADDSSRWQYRHRELTTTEEDAVVSSPLRKETDTSERTGSNMFTRMIVHCDFIIGLENCWEEISDVGEDIRLIHWLRKGHLLAIEALPSALDDLEAMGFYVTVDRVRETLAMKESLHYVRRHLQSPGQQVPYGAAMIRAIDVWDQYHVQGQGVRVCIVDTGVYADHPDFSRSNLQGWDSFGDFVTPWSEDTIGHGTHVTGILAASDNDQGYVGVAPGVEIYFIRVFTNEGIFYGSDVVAAGQACRDNGAHLISMSLGGRDFDQSEHDFFRDLYLEDGIIAVASAGNTGGPELNYPAGYDSVISVTACDENKRVPDFATFNSFVDIAAPGSNIPSTYIGADGDNGSDNETYVAMSGTSMAVPYVVGTLALMKSAFPDATADDLLYALVRSTQSLLSKTNLGLVDALAAVQMLETGVDILEVASPSCLTVELTLYTDEYGEETAYRLRRISDNVIFWKGIGLESYSAYLESSCVDPNDCYEFIVRDSYGDGIVEPGSIKLRFGAETKLNDGKFGGGGKMLFGDIC